MARTLEQQSHADRPALGAPGDKRKWWVLAAMVFGLLMPMLDNLVVNVALPTIQRELGAGVSSLAWIIDAYTLTFASFMLTGGALGDLYGRKRFFMAGLVVFTIGSLLCGLSGSTPQLIAFRATQGLGAALLLPGSLSIITATFHGPERAKALGVWGAVGGAGAAVGVLLGGALTELVDWRAIFIINLPVGLALTAGALAAIPSDPARPRWRGLDLRGALLATASLGALVYALSQARTSGWASTQTIGLSAAALAGLAAFAVLERRTAQPLLRVQRLRDRGVGGGFAMMLAASAVLFGSFLLCSLYLQTVLATGALATGLAFLPFAVAIGAGVHAGSHVVTHAGVRVPLGAGFAVAAAGMLLLSGVSAHGSYAADVLPGMLVAGLGLGIVLVSVSVSVLTGAGEHEAGMLSGLTTTGHEIGGSLGIAVLATIAATGIGDAFLAAAIIAAVAGAAALVILPAAKHFLPKLALAPRIAVH
jgi:EmrB/QacA subfamily drug resistance transporter